VLTWVPSEAQGPGLYPIQVCVTEADHPLNVITCLTMKVIVLEDNSAPVLAPIEAQVIAEGIPLHLSAAAYDVDLPAQSLRFSLDQGAPLGASIDPESGVLSWTPNATQATDQHTITVRVTDDGNPPKSATTTFTASPRGGVVSAVRLVMTRLMPGYVTLTMLGGVPGTVYHLERTTALRGQPNAAEWTVLRTIMMSDQTYRETINSTNADLFYRVRRGP
jgi:hypothetical protein